MAVKIVSELSRLLNRLHSRYKNRLRLGMSGYAQLFFYSFLFCYPSFSYAGPNLSGVVGGNASATVHTHGLTTEIHQNLNSVAIDWNSFDVNSNEIVNFVQPGSSSIALNQILSTSASDIRGQINANGQIVLVNPNGIFFGETASVNVGGLIASGLNISTTDFLNGDYIFNEVVGSDGFVINSGLINASLGGNVALLGKQVTNEGVISAQLGSVNLAAGKAAVLTFDQQGLLGVKVTKAILQDELGLDPAVLNSGEINAEGGKVLLTASVSQDIFSQAVNSGDIEQATSVVVNEDGTFTLGAGADVVNTGTVDVSTTATKQDAGKIVLLGENITNSGVIKANADRANAGEIELHASNKTELIESAIISATSKFSGNGGNVKILGDKVGLLGSSVVDVSGAEGGGVALVGGDKLGENTRIRNANFVYIDDKTKVLADATFTGDGGKIITYADDTAKIYGSLYARGGLTSGNGGFIETSGKQGFNILTAPSVSSLNGDGGLWLIDPYNIVIQSTGDAGISVDASGNPDLYTSNAEPATLGVDTILAALGSGDVKIVTGSSTVTSHNLGDISFNANLLYEGIGTGNSRTLTLEAANNISFETNRQITDSIPGTQDSLNVNLYANGDVLLKNGATINTNGGNFTVGYDTTGTVNDIIPTSFTSYTDDGLGNITTAIINTSGAAPIGHAVAAVNAGSITINTSGAVNLNGLVARGGANAVSDSQSGVHTGGAGGDVTINASAISSFALIDTQGEAGRYDTNANNGNTGGAGGAGGFVDITSTTGSILVNEIITSGGSADGSTSTSGNAPYLANGGDAGTIDLTLTAVAGNTLTLNGNLSAKGARGYIDGGTERNGNGAAVTLTGDVELANNIVIDTLGYRDGTASRNGSDGAILFNNNIVADANANARTIELISGASDTTINGSVGVGSDNALQTFTISSAFDASVNAITTLDGADITTEHGTLLNGVLITASNSIDLGGNITTNAGTADSAGNVDLNGAVTLSADVTMTTSDATDSGSVDFSSTVDSFDATLRSLTINAGIEAVSLNGAVGGGTNMLRGLLINNGSTITTAAVTTDSVGFKANGTDLVLGGNIVTNNGGAVDLDSVNRLILSNSIDTTNGNGQVDITISGTDTGNDATGDYFSNDTSGGSISSGAGTVNITTAGSNANNSGAILGAITTTGTGALNVTTTGGSITQSANATRDLNINGTASFNAGTSDIILDNTNNNLVGAIAFTSTGDVSLVNSNATVLDTSVVGGAGKTFTIDARNGGISQFASSTLDVNGVASFISLDGIIFANNAGNDFTGAVSVSNSTTNETTYATTIRDMNSITLGATSLSGNTYTVNAVTDTALNSNITLASNVVASADSTLTLNANNDINITADQTAGTGALTLNFNSDLDLDTNGGQININTASIDSNNGAVTFNGATVLMKSTAIDAGIAKIDFTGTVDGTAARTESLTLTAGNIDFDANVGATTRTGLIDITASGVINAVNASITANALTVNANNTSFTSGNINTQGDAAYALNDDKDGAALAGNSGAVVINSDGAINIANIITTGGEASTNLPGYSGGNVTLITTDQINVTSISSQGGSRNISLTDSQGFNGGNISLAATDIVIGAIASNGTNAIGTGNNDGGSAGTVSLTATDDTTNGTPSITLDGDINTETGTATNDGTVPTPSVIAQLSLVGADAPTGLVTINHPAAFTSNINITGSNGVDTLVSARRDSGINTWNINTINTLNDKVAFSSFENLTGGNAVSDTFTIVSGTIDGLINGGTNAINNDYIDVLNLPAVATTVQLNDPAAIAGTNATVGVLEVNNIEQINGGAAVANELLSRIDIDANWFIDASGSGRVGDSSLAATDTTLAEGATAFSNFNTLTGSDANADRFEILSNTVTGMTLNGGAFAADLADTSKYDTLIGPDVLNTPLNTRWTLTADNNGTLADEPASALSITFVGIENLTSGSGDDVFNFGNFNVSGSVDAGEFLGDNDSIDLSQNADAFTFDVSGGVNGNGRTNFEQVTGNGISTLSAGTSTAIYTWSVRTENAGNVIDDSSNNLVFSGFSNLTGGAGADTFDIYDNTGIDDATRGNITGLIDGGTGTNILNIYTAGLIDGGTGKAVTVQLEGVSNTANGFLDVVSIGEINASTNIAFNSTLLAGSSGTNSWDITGDRAGTVSNTVTNASFTGFSTLTGADNVVDNFTVNSTVTTLPNTMTLNGGASVDSNQFDTLTGANINSIWTISDLDIGAIVDDTTGAVLKISFDGIEALTGGTANDSFELTNTSPTVNGSLRGTINGGTGGNDSLQAGNVANTWEITAANEGNVNGIDTLDITEANAYDFTGIETLIGNDNTDRFTFNGGTLDGSINGGLGTDYLTGDTGNNTWDLDAENQGTLDRAVDSISDNFAEGYDFTGIENLVGNTGDDDFILTGTTGSLTGTIDATAGGANSLTGGDTVAGNSWAITGLNQGRVTRINTSDATGTVPGFTGIQEVIGGATNDTFVIGATGSVASVNGGTGGVNELQGRDIANLWTLDITRMNAGTLADNTDTLAPVDYVDSFDNIQTITGGAGVDTLQGSNNTNGTTWSLDNPNGGSVSETDNATNTITFEEMENLAGGTEDDLFNLNGGTLTGTIDGGAGTGSDSIADTDNDGTANYWTITGADSGYLKDGDTLTATQNIINTNAGTGTSDGFTGIENIIGGFTDSDIFKIMNTLFIQNINGGDDINANDPNDVVDFTGLAGTYNVNLGDNAGFRNIDIFNGNSNGTLVAENGINFWIIDGLNTGTINGFRFTGFENIRGGNVQDTFDFQAAGTTQGSIRGLVDGFANVGSANDVINYYTPLNVDVGAAAFTPIDIQLDGVAGAAAIANGYLDVINIDQINANASYTNTLRGSNGSNAWEINGNQSGTYNVNTAFTNFDVLRGGASDDTFTITATTLTDLITVYGGDVNSNNDELVGYNVTSTWTLNGSNAGTLVDNDATVGVDVNVAFVNVGNLTGDDAANDTFNIDTGANFTGVIDGGAGASDEITNRLATATSWTIDAADGGDLIGVLNNFTNIENLNGTASAKDTFTLADGGSISGNVSGGASTTDEIINTTTAQSFWAVSGTNSGTVDSINTFDGIENLTGTNNVKDTFNIQTGGFISGTIEGGTANDDVIVNQLTVDTTWNIIANSQGNMFDVINNFTGIESLTGAANVVDTYNLQDAGLLNGTVSGGGGVDVNGAAIIDQITNQRTTATAWSITGADEGTVAGINLFTGIAKLNGADDVTDTFSLAEAGSISDSINGGSGLNVDAITSLRITTTNWSITGVNQGTVTGITLFTGVEKLTGSAAVDNFSLDGGSLSTTIDGGDGSDRLTASDANSVNGANVWVLTAGTNQGNINGLDTADSIATYDFINIENLTGNALDDTFTFNAGSSINGLINGAGESRDINGERDTLGDQVDLSSLIGALDVVLGTGYTDIETFTGNADTESRLTASNGTDNQWRIFNVNDPASATKLTNQGTVTDDSGNIVTFFSFNNITGGNQIDNFLIESNGDIEGEINGGLGNDNLDLSAQTGIIDRTVGDSLNTDAATFNSVEGIKGNANLGINGNNSILRVSGNTPSTWTIDGLNSGEVTAGSNTTRFTNFNILQGGGGTDVFDVITVLDTNTNITTYGAIIDQSSTNDVSRINGGGGNDTLNVSLTGENALTSIKLFAADGFIPEDTDTINFSTSGSPGTGDKVIINGATAGFDTATYSVDYATGIATHTYENTTTGAMASVAYSDVVTISNDSAVNDSVQAANLIISGTNDDANRNIVTLTGNGEGAGNFDLSRSTANSVDWADVDYSNKQSLTVRNLGIGGTITVMNNIDVNTTSGFIDFSASNINTGNQTLTANELRLDSVTGNIVSSSPILTNVSDLQVSNSSANIYISETNDLNLLQVDTTRLLSIIANGTITDSDSNTQALTSSGNLSLRTTNNSANNIILDNALNNLTGTITLNTVDGATATLVNAGSETKLGTSSVGLAGTLNVTSSNGSITSTETETIVAGTANLSSSNAINLTGAANDFTTLSIVTAKSANIRDTNDLILGNVTIDAGTLQITADSIDQVDGTAITQTPNQFDGTAGNITFTIGAGIIDLGNLANDFIGDVALNNSGEFFVEIADVNDIQLAASNIGSGTFTVNSNGKVSQTGRISQETPADINTSAVTINAGVGEIDLTNINNNFTGTINLNNNNTSTQTVALTNLNNIVLAGANVDGQFNITARGGFDISQIAPLTVAGNALFTVDAGRSIILDENMNNLQSGVSFNSNNGLALFDVTIFNNGALDLGTINVSNNLDVLANGEITNTGGILTVGQVALFDATNNNITVGNLNNNFNNIVLLNANTVIVNDINSINIGSTIVGRTDSTIAADLNITTLTGNINDVANATLSVGGVSNLTAGSLANAGTIQLDETANEFNQVNIINAQDVTLFDLDTDANGIDLRSNIIAGNLDVTSAGDITNANNALSGALVVNGTSSFTTTDAGNIQLNNAANALTGALTFSATTSGVALNNVGIVNTLATNINALNITTNLNITSGGAITQNAAFTVGNLTTLDAINTSTLVPQDIMLESPNNLNLLTILNANNVTIKNATNTLSIDQLNAAGAIDIMSGALTIADDIVARSVALDSGAGLTRIASIDTAGSVGINSEGLTVSGTLDAGDVNINAGGATAAFLGDVTTTSTLDIAANGLTINGAIETGGNTVLDATTGVANLNNGITVLAGDLTVNGNGINQADNILVQNDVTFNSTQGIAMDAASSTTATDGNIQYNADNTVNLGLLSAVNGTAGVNTSANIVDANGDLTNFLAINMVTRTGTGMGTGDGTRINTQVETIDVINSGSSSLWIDQRGGPEISELEIIALQNDTVRTAAGDPGGITNIRADESFLINPNSVVVDRDTGVLFMTSVNGGFSGTGLFVSGTDPLTDPSGSLINPDFTGNQVTFFALNGDFGSSFRPLVLNVPKVNNNIPGEDSFIFIDSARVSARYFPEQPDNLTTTGVDVSALGVLSAIAGELLVEIETLGDIDPAIFTDLQNYSLQDISIRMPRDQLFEDELEEESQLQ